MYNESIIHIEATYIASVFNIQAPGKTEDEAIANLRAKVYPILQEFLKLHEDSNGH